MLLILIQLANSDSQTANASVILGNTPPTLDPTPSLNDTIVRINDLLFCYPGTYYDANNDTFGGGQEFRWKKDGELIPNQASQTLNVSNVSVGMSITCESRVNDSYGDFGSWVASSNSAILQNTPPTVYSVALTPDPASSSQSVTCNWNYSDADIQSEAGSIFNFYINGIFIKNGTYGTDSQVLSDTYYVKGDIVACSVLGYDGIDYSNAYVNDTITISNSVPSFTTITLTPSNATKANTLTCQITNRTDDDGDPLYNYYQFLDSDNTTVLQSYSTDNTMDCEFVAGCTKGDRITCVGKVGDGIINSSTKNTSSIISNTAPQARTVYIYPYTPDNSSNLNCRYTYYDIDSDGMVASYFRWFLNNSLYPFTFQNLTNNYTNINDSWRCEVTVYDGSLNSTKVNSTSAQIGTSNPRNVYITNNGTVDEGRVILFNWTWDDPQLPAGGPYTHYVCNSSAINESGCKNFQYCKVIDDTSSTLCNFTANSLWQKTNYAYVMVMDGLNQTSPIEQTTWTFNHKPDAANATMEVTSNGEYNIYECSLNLPTDSDGDTLFVSYAFTQSNGTILQSYSGTDTFITNTGPATHGDPLTCNARIYDGRIYSDIFSTSSHFIVTNLTISSPRYVDTYVTISVDINNVTNMSFVNLTIRNPFNIYYSNIPMIYNETSNDFKYTFAPNAVGIWSIIKIYAVESDIGSYYFKGQNDIISVTVAPTPTPAPGPAGGGGAVQIQEVPIIANITGFCGDGICQNSENPANCWQDCKVNFDTIITCIWDDTIECNWSQTWFPIVLLVTLGALSIISVALVELQKRKIR